MRKRRHNRIRTKKGMWIVVITAFVIGTGLLTARYNLVNKQAALAAQQKRLEKQIEKANDKKKDLDDREAYMKSDEYAEEVAREKFGMVKDNEILFKAKK